MRVIVDPVLCEGNGICAQVAPDVFELGDDDRTHVLVERPGETRRADVETAIRRCPRQAIQLVR